MTTRTHTVVTKYPTRTHLALLCAWTRFGPVALDPVGQAPRHPATTRNMIHIKEMISRLGMPAPYEQLRRSALGDVQNIDDRLRQSLYARCRLTGAVLEHAQEPVPLTGLQMHVLRLSAEGRSTVEICVETNLRQGTVREVMYRTRHAHGCTNTAQLVATAYREGWFPSRTEIRELSALIVHLDKNVETTA